MTSEILTIFNQVDFLLLAPVIMSVYQLYLKKPIRVKDGNQVNHALKKVMKVAPVELFPGIHNVTPEGAGYSYTLEVYDAGDGDNAAYLQVNYPSGNSFVKAEATQSGEVSTSIKVPGIVELYGQSGKVYVVGEGEGSYRDIRNYRIFGALMYRPKGEPIFPKK